MSIPEDRSITSDSLKGTMAQGALWMAGMRWCLRFIGLINTLILARVLTPDDFGIIAMTMVVVGFMEFFADFYVDQLLLREKNTNRQMYDSAWTIQVALGMLMGVVIFFSAPLIAMYYNEPRVELVVQIVSLRAVISGFQNIGVVDFRKQLDFNKEFRFWVITRLVQFVLTLALVLYYRSYIALAISIPLSILVKVIVSYIMSGYRPQLCLSYIKPFWNFAKWLMISNFANYANQRGDEFVVGSVASSNIVGAYYVASDISTMVTREVILPTGRAFLPIYAKISGDSKELSNAFNLVIQFAAFVAFPIGLGASAVADDFVTVVLGEQWIIAVPFFQWIAIYGALAGFVTVFRPMLLIQGLENISAYLQVGEAVLVISLLFAIASIGEVVDIAIGRAALMSVFFLLYCFLATKFCLQSVASIAVGIWRPVLSSCAMYLVVKFFHGFLFDNLYMSLLFDVLIGAMFYLTSTLLLWVLAGCPDGAEKEMQGWLLKKLSKGAR